MTSSPKTIISCAVTGSIHTPSMSAALPVTPDEIAQQAVDAHRAGAAILHLHARDPRTGRPSGDPALFGEFLPKITAETDAVINITTGGSTDMAIEDRLAAARAHAPELASLNMGSMNFVFAGAADRVTEWRHDWEEPYVRGSSNRIFANTFDQIERTLRELGDGLGVRFEFECYDVGHLYTLAHFADRGLVQPPLLVQTIFGVLGGIGADLDNFRHMATIADRLFGADHQLSCFAAGRHQMRFATAAGVAGAHVRVGLEDSLYLERGRLATSNAEQVEKVVRILREVGRDIATPAEARALLDLRGHREEPA